jgi:hypothetical protein
MILILAWTKALLIDKGGGNQSDTTVAYHHEPVL